jgi:hypothetical protein
MFCAILLNLDWKVTNSLARGSAARRGFGVVAREKIQSAQVDQVGANVPPPL